MKLLQESQLTSVISDTYLVFNILIYLFGYFWSAVVSIALPIFSLRKCHILFVVKSKTESMKPALTGTFTAKVVRVFTETYRLSSMNI